MKSIIIIMSITLAVVWAADDVVRQNCYLFSWNRSTWQ